MQRQDGGEGGRERAGGGVGGAGTCGVNLVTYPAEFCAVENRVQGYLAHKKTPNPLGPP